MNAIAPPALSSNHPLTRALPQTRALTHKPLDQLEEDIIGLSQHINASEYEFMVLLREFDLRQGWKAYHFNHCAEWLNMKCGMSPRTAREKLRVANALFDLPALSVAFQNGDLSYSKARALTRVATPQSEQDLLRFALKANAAHVDRHCYELRNARRTLSTADANRAHRHRSLSYAPTGDGSVAINIELPEEQARLVLRALELAATVMKDSDAAYFEEGIDPADLTENDEDGSREPSQLQQQQADALVDLARSYLAGGEAKRSCTADHYQVTVHVDERALRSELNEQSESNKQSKSELPIETVRRPCCDGAIVPLVQDEAGSPPVRPEAPRGG
jgi:hypothetical protein